jgi:hypothetical protein
MTIGCRAWFLVQPLKRLPRRGARPDADVLKERLLADLERRKEPIHRGDAERTNNRGIRLRASAVNQH